MGLWFRFRFEKRNLNTKTGSRRWEGMYHFLSSLDIKWASLVAQLVKNPPAMQETLVQFLGWDDFLEKGMATHSSILACRIPWTA